MSALWLLVMLVGGFTAKEPDTEMTWEEYKIKYKKHYHTPEEDEKHRLNFLVSLQHVQSHNEKRERGEVSYSIGINQFSDQDRTDRSPSTTPQVLKDPPAGEPTSTPTTTTGLTHSSTQHPQHLQQRQRSTQSSAPPGASPRHAHSS